jgi:hypothetical protein
MRENSRDKGASVRAKLLNLARGSDQAFEPLLIRYAQERWLYRLSLELVPVV